MELERSKPKKSKLKKQGKDKSKLLGRKVKNIKRNNILTTTSRGAIHLQVLGGVTEARLYDAPQATFEMVNRRF